MTVEIHGQRYPVKSRLDAGYVTELAQYVDAKMVAAEDEAPAADSLGVAVLAALNIADEYFRCRDVEHTHYLDITTRVAALERLIDTALEGAGGAAGL